METCPVSDHTLCRNVAPMTMDNALHDCQPDPGTAELVISMQLASRGKIAGRDFFMTIGVKKTSCAPLARRSSAR